MAGSEFTIDQFHFNDILLYSKRRATVGSIQKCWAFWTGLDESTASPGRATSVLSTTWEGINRLSSVGQPVNLSDGPSTPPALPRWAEGSPRGSPSGCCPTVTRSGRSSPDMASGHRQWPRPWDTQERYKIGHTILPNSKLSQQRFCHSHGQYFNFHELPISNS